MSLSGHQSARSKSDTWLTPPEILAKLGEFDLDPCVPENMPWKTAGGSYCVEYSDGLTLPWYGRVWLNPPFGNQAVHWLRKLAKHGNGIALIPARTETAMFYQCVWEVADAVCFIKGRPHFHDAEGKRAPFNSGAPICLIAYGRHNAQVLRQAGLGFTTAASRNEPKAHGQNAASLPPIGQSGRYEMFDYPDEQGRVFSRPRWVATASEPMAKAIAAFHRTTRPLPAPPDNSPATAISEPKAPGQDEQQ